MKSSRIWQAATKFAGSLVGRAIILSIAPLLVFSLSATIYLAYYSISSARENLIQHGEIIAKSYAKASEYGLYIGDIEQLQGLITGALVDPSIHSVRIFDENGGLVVQAGREERISAGTASHLLSEFVMADSLGTDLGAYGDKVTGAGSQRNHLGRVDVELSLAKLQDQQAMFAYWTLLFVGMSLLVSVVWGVRSSYSLLKPFNRIVETVNRIREGDLGARIEHMSSGELQMLERGINEMAENIQQSQRHLESSVESATSQLKVTVGELRESNDELRIARVSAVKAGDAKAEFLAMVSHELRTPLNSVIGYANLLQEMVREPTARQHAETIHRAGRHLAGIINDVLDLSRLNSSELEYHEEAFNPVEVVENSLDLFSHEAHRKSLELMLHIHQDTPAMVLGDRQRLSQVLANLIGNAVKFTSEGYVLVEVDGFVESDELKLRVIVSDTGIGIPAEMHEKIFEPFEQGERAMYKQYVGTGLGLTISRMMMEKMHGEIGVLDSFTGGARLFAVLPALAPADAQVINPKLQDKRVLVVESHPLARRALRAQLTALGLKVTVQADTLWMEENSAELGSMFDLVVLGMNKLEVETYQVNDRFSQGIVRPMPRLLLIGDEEVAQNLSSNYGCADLSILTKPAPLRRLTDEILALLYNDVGSVDVVVAPAPIVAQGTREAIVGDDNAESRALLRILLEQRGFTVHTVSGGKEVLSLAAKQAVDMIFLDLHMPDLDGVSTCSGVRKLPNIDACMPIVAVTADVTFEGASGADAAGGFDDIIYKPITVASLDEVLEQWFEDSMLLPALPADSVSDAEHLQQPQVQAAVDKHIETMHLALRNQDRDSFRDEAHQLLGVAGYFELVALRETLLCLNQQADSASDAQLLQWLDDLDQIRSAPLHA